MEIPIEFSEAELVEIANSVTFSAFHAEAENDDEWKAVEVALAVFDKIEAAFPSIIESDDLICVREILVVRRRLVARKNTA